MAYVELRPDSRGFNVIEEVFDLMKKKLREKLTSSPVSRKDALFRLVKACRDEIPQETIAKMIKSMPKRSRSAIRLAGEMTEY